MERQKENKMKNKDGRNKNERTYRSFFDGLKNEMKRMLKFATICILSMLLIPFLPTAPLTWNQETTRGPLGSHLYYRMYSPTTLKIGSNTTINFTFTAQAEIFIKHIYIGIWGSAFHPIPDFSVFELVESNKSLGIWESIDYSIRVKPLVEGAVVVRTSAEYNFNSGSEYDYHEIILDAKSMTYSELRQRYLLFRDLTYGFGISTIVLILIVAYAYVKKKEGAPKMKENLKDD